MGINGLLPLLKSIHKPCSLKKFDGKTLGVDAYGWLHRGTVSCAMELAMGKPTRRFVDFAMHRVRMLQHFGVTPYIIFDGDYLPSKAATEADRSKRREDSRKAGLELLNAGKTSQAYLEFQKAVDVTPEMARQLIDELKKVGVQYVVAPYEADAQMVYLETKGIIHGIISEDSDLLVFGAKCLLTKLDQYGNCIEINKADFCAVREVSFTGWSDVEFRRMAILSGCDYLSSMTNMGLKTAYRMVRKHKTIEKIIRMLQFDSKFFVPKGYLEAYQRAELTFLHQRVFCPQKRRLVFHTEPKQPIDDANMPFLGIDVDPEIARGVACGDLNPITKLPIIIRQNKMVTSSSLFASSPRPRLQRTVSVADPPKKGKDIDTFFKAKRVPLAELDINCFTPSPTQQDALRRNTGPWDATPPPRPYLNRSLTEVQRQSQSISSENSRPPSVSSTGRTIQAPPLSEPRPVKRARLCEDTDTPDTPNEKVEVRSRFFGAADPSPSVNRNAKGKRSKKHDITIFSDDSVEEAMLSIPNAGGKFEIYSESEATGTSNKRVAVERDSQASITTDFDAFPISQASLPSLSSSSTITSSADFAQPDTPAESTASSISLYQFSERFSATSTTTTTPKPTTLSNRLPTPISTSLRPSRIPLAVKASIAVPKHAFTPLQRLGLNATNQSKFPVTPPMTPNTPLLAKNNSNVRPRSILSKNVVPFPEVADLREKKTVRGDATPQITLAIEPAMVPLPKADENENMALDENRTAPVTAGKGSEDLIVHDSEDEEPLSPDDHQAVLPRLDLGRFLFVG